MTGAELRARAAVRTANRSILWPPGGLSVAL